MGVLTIAALAVALLGPGFADSSTGTDGTESTTTVTNPELDPVAEVAVGEAVLRTAAVATKTVVEAEVAVLSNQEIRAVMPPSDGTVEVAVAPDLVLVPAQLDEPIRGRLLDNLFIYDRESNDSYEFVQELVAQDADGKAISAISILVEVNSVDR